MEDDRDNGQSLKEAAEALGYEVEWATTAGGAVAAFQNRGADVVLCDLVLPDRDGIAVLKTIREKDGGRTPVMLMTAYASVDSGVRAMKEGAYDYLQKPLDLEDLQAKLGRAAEAARLRRQVESLHAEARKGWSTRDWVAESAAMKEIARETRSLAGTRATVLVHGESGTGKELVARALHADGDRAGGPFVAVNCAAFTENLLESELFGHEKGAFTGATGQHAGAFERAEGGTLFLDEIGDAPASVQVKLLRVLEDRRVLRVGGQESFEVDVRVVSATHRNLEEEVKAGRFRQDLWYRLNVIALELPPLRDRKEDIRPLAERFAAWAQKEYGRAIRDAEPGWFARLEAWRWPGNIRELKNTVEAAVITTKDSVLRAEGLRIPDGWTPTEPGVEAKEEAPVNRVTAVSKGGDEWRIPAGTSMEQIERHVLASVLKRTGWDRGATAAELGWSRKTVQRKIADFGLEEANNR